MGQKRALKNHMLLFDNSNDQDVMWLYVKWVLEMEKNKWYTAKKYFQDALRLTKFENWEIVRCYWLCEYWYGNREKWLELLKESFTMHNKDAEVIYNIIEVYMLEQKYKDAKKMIWYFYKNYEKLETIDKGIDYYDHKISLFEKYIVTQRSFSL